EDAGYLTQAQAEKAKAELNKTMSGRRRNTQSSQYFADWVLDQLPDILGEVREDLVVITTLDPEWQAMADKAIAEVMDKDGEAHKAQQAALVSMTPNGAIRAMVGGRSYADSQYNRAAQALRQPGSSFKLFVYLAGLEAGLRPDSIVEDQPISVKVAGGYWKPKNYTHKYLGEIPLREAVANSLNTVAVQVAQQAGLESVEQRHGAVAQHCAGGNRGNAAGDDGRVCAPGGGGIHRVSVWHCADSDAGGRGAVCA
ncbi:MAG: hypothetical protein EBV03_02120, partial [Proteobacteria bacterium]|nr:hypothetical protein [Pseudomonadota bacterium]